MRNKQRQIERKREREREREMGEEGEGPLFGTEVMKGRKLWYRLYVFSVLVGISMVWVYRAQYIPQNGEKGRWAWIGLFAAELWFGLYWLLTQSVRWNPTHRFTHTHRLSIRYKDNLPGVDILVCTADPKIEPPIMVINTVLSVMAYEYPTEKLSVYLSDDGGSEFMFYALLEASRFAKTLIPFCNKFNVEPRSPGAYFKDDFRGAKDGLLEWQSTKKLYEEMENRINSVVRSGNVPDNIRKQHKGFTEWNGQTTSRDHQPIVQIIIDGRDEDAVDNEGCKLPTLVYMSREKKPQWHHNFKAGAMNSLLRVSSEISNGEFILNVDCDMYSNNSKTIKDALCFFMDEGRGHEFGYVQLPQNFNNITKNDIYGNSLLSICEVDFHGLDGHGGPLYIGSGCYHRRESLLGKKYEGDCRSARILACERDYTSSASTLEEKAKSLITCSYEHNTQWGKEVGLKYGCPVEDVITGLSIQCNGWKSIYFNPPRKGFLGVAPVTLEQILVQHKRWSEGNFQIFLSKYCPLLYGHKKITLGLRLCYTIYSLWAPCSVPTLYYVIVPPLFLLRGISLFPAVGDVWFLPFAYVMMVTSIYDLWESIKIGSTLKGWWNEERIWLYKRIASYSFAFFDTIMKLIGVGKSAFVVTAKVADEQVLKRYEMEMIEFGSTSLVFNIISTLALLSPLCLLGVAKMLIMEGMIVLDSMLIQIIISGAITLINIPVYKAMFLRTDAGRMPTSVTSISFAIAMLACIWPL